MQLPGDGGFLWIQLELEDTLVTLKKELEQVMRINVAHPTCSLRTVLTVVIVVSIGIHGLGAHGFGLQNPSAGDGGIRVLPVQGSVYMLAGAGSNIAVSVGPDGAILVDAGSEAMADEVVAAVRQITSRYSPTTWLRKSIKVTARPRSA